VVAIPIIVVAGSMLLTTVIAMSRERTTSADTARAAEAIRSVIESMRNEPFDRVVRLYGPDPLDDPAGPGTAPGDRFTIPGVTPLEGQDSAGRIRLPLVDMTEPGGLPDWQLREDMQDTALGMPRDIDGNGVVDEVDHSEDYEILPVLVEAEWQGRLGPRRFRIFTYLTDYRL
jgi:hypothetical protein